MTRSPGIVCASQSHTLQEGRGRREGRGGEGGGGKGAEEVNTRIGRREWEEGETLLTFALVSLRSGHAPECGRSTCTVTHFVTLATLVGISARSSTPPLRSRSRAHSPQEAAAVSAEGERLEIGQHKLVALNLHHVRLPHGVPPLRPVHSFHSGGVRSRHRSCTRSRQCSGACWAASCSATSS